ncbi:MAG TPA: hypothetical protein VFG23_22650 [Polyangia bacterium]|nr:hypothetical protein [Polyangia bacterium]
MAVERDRDAFCPDLECGVEGFAIFRIPGWLVLKLFLDDVRKVDVFVILFPNLATDRRR